MKVVKKINIFLFMALIAVLCTFSSACGTSHIVLSCHEIYSCVDFRLDTYGVPVLYKMDDAVIEMQNYSDKGMVLIPDYSIIKDSGRYSYYLEPSSPENTYGGIKQLLYGETLFYEGEPVIYKMFQWRPVCGFWDDEGKDVVDYISFISRKNDKIVGYAVVYFWVGKEYGYGKVLADKECSNLSETAVKQKIQNIIDRHKK